MTDLRALAEKATADAPWPVDCKDPAGCERRRACGYIDCRHWREKRDISAEVDAAAANRAALELEL